MSFPWSDGSAVGCDYTPRRGNAAQRGPGLQVANGYVYGNPRVPKPELDATREPVTFNRIGTRWGDVQLGNGWMSTNYGRRMTHPNAGYLSEVIPVVPGQTRLIGYGQKSAFPMRGPSPSQWQTYTQATAGSQPSYGAGPGSFYGSRPSGYRGSLGG